MSKHTPGPWEATRTKPIDGIRVARGWCISPVNGERPLLDLGQVHLSASQDETTQEANARLIAAAPELLAACRAYNDAFSFISENPPHHSLRDAARKCRAAIARATGQAATV